MRPTGTLVPRMRQAPDGGKEGGSQPTDISVINRRVLLAPAHPIDKRKNYDADVKKWLPTLDIGSHINARGQARLAAGAQRRLAAVACRVEPVLTHPAPPQTRTCAIHAYGSSNRATAALMQSTDLLWSGLVSSKSLPCLLPADALPDDAFPPVGRLGLTSPRSSVLCVATT